MTMDVSRLGIVVESTGIVEAKNALAGSNGNGGLAGAAAKAEKNVDKLTASLNKMMSVNASASALALAQSLGGLNTTLTGLHTNLRNTISELNGLAPAMDRASGASNGAAEANKRNYTTGNVVTNTLKAMTTAALAYTGVNFAMSIVKQADSWQMMTARLQNATGSMNNALVAQNQMFDLSQRLRVPLEDQVRLYTRMAPAMQRLGKDSNATRDTVEGIATALQLGGANGAEMSSVMTQLSQSYGSGVLNGAEFNAVAENGQVIMKALMEYTGKTQAQLKKLGSQGKLSIDTMNAAIEKALPKWREQFDNLPVTFEGGIQRVKNAWTRAIGEMGQDTGFNKELSKSLKIVEDMIPAVAMGLGNAFISVMRWIDQNKSKLAEIWDQILGIAKDVWSVGGKIGEWIGEIIGVGKEFSVIAALLFSIRLFIAGFQDGLTLVAGTVAAVGAVIYRAMINPLVQLVTGPVAWLLEGFAKLAGVGAEVAGYVGMDGAAASLKGIKDTADGFAKTMSGIGTASTNIGAALTQTASDYFSKIAEGRGEVARLMNEEKSVTTLKRDRPSVMDEGAFAGSSGVQNSKPEDAAAAKAAAAEAKHYKDALEDVNAKLRQQQELKERLATYGLGYDKMGPAQKQAIELEEHINRLRAEGATGINAVKIKHEEELLAIVRKTAALESENERTLERMRSEQAVLDKGATRVQQLNDEAAAVERKVATYGMAKGAIEAMELAQAKANLTELQAIPEDLKTEYVRNRIALLNEEVLARERIAVATDKLGQLDTEKEFDKLFDPKKAEKFGDVLSKGFGKAGKAIGGVVKALEKYEVRQAKVAKAYEIAQKETDPTKRAKMVEQASELEAESRIASYADMAGAAKGFFEEGSKGYKVLQAAEMTFRAFEIAMAVKNFAEKSGLLAMFTGLFVTAKATETTAEVASVGPHVAAEGAKQSANALTALTSALAAPFPVNLAAFAVVAAILASIGVMAGGGGGGSVDISAQRQESQGTGTVFGDSSAKSESISKSIELLAENSDIALRYSSDMLASLRSIEYSLTGATNGVIRNRGVLTGSSFETIQSSTFSKALGGIPLIGGFLGGVMDSLFGSKTTLRDSGITGGTQSVGSILQDGMNISGYQDVNKKKKFFGVTTSSKNSRNYSEIDQSIKNEFGNVVEGMVATLVSAGKALGFSAEEVSRKLELANITLGDISLKGLGAEDVKKQLEAVFSAIGDTLSMVALPSVERFQKAGEGLLETAVRVATGVEKAQYELEKLSINTVVNFTDVAQPLGDVGAEIVRQSIMLKEAGTGVGEIINALGGEAVDIADTYRQLINIRKSFMLMGIGNDVTRELIRAAGGLEALQSALSSYNDNFFSDAEKSTMQFTALREEFYKLNVIMPASKEGFRALVETLTASGDAGKELAMKVLLLSDSFAEVADAYSDDYSESLSSAHDALAEAYQRESEALQTTIDTFKDFSKSLGEFKDSLLLGDTSPLSNADKYSMERARFEDVLAKAKTGDQVALGEFQDIAGSFLESSKGYNASGAGYQADFERVLSETTWLQSMTDGMATEAQLQLDALNKQVEGIMVVNESVISVAQAIDNIAMILMAGNGGLTTVVAPWIDGSHADGLGYVPFDGYVAELHKGETVLTAEDAAAYRMDYSQYGRSSDESLVNEIKALREQVASLREGQREQTGQIISANFEAQERNAQLVVEGQKDAASSATYSEKVKVTLV